MRMRFRAARKTFRKLNQRPVPIVADAAIATGTIGDGRLIPLVILDTTERPDLEELIRVHQYVRPGDVVSQWATIEDGSGHLGLLLTFEKPMDVTALILFDVVKQGVLVDQDIRTKGLYIQAGKEGDRFFKDTERPKVLMEIPDTSFGQVWEDLFLRAIIKHMRSAGLTRREAKDGAKSLISQWREFGGIRMRAGVRAPRRDSGL